MPTTPSTPTVNVTAPIVERISPPPLVRPSVDREGARSLFVHQQNQTIYRVVDTTEGGGGVTVRYERIGDGRTHGLTLGEFYGTFRVATHVEVTNTERATPYLTAHRAGANLERVTQICTALDNQNPDQPTNEQTEVHLPPRPPRGGRRPQPGDEEGQPVEEVGELIEPSELNDFNRLVLHPEASTALLTSIRVIARSAQMEEVFHLSQVSTIKGSVMLFYGESGTGKTEAAKAVARNREKKLYKVDYASLISKYYGDTAKHIRAVFVRARALDAIPFFDEADSICSRRIDMSHDGATTVNQNRNVLMQELDKYVAEVPGVPVILTTNLYHNFDSALVRRINKAIKFDLPDEGMRRRILDNMFPVQDRFAEDINLDLIATMTEGFSGGNLLTMVLNTYDAASEAEDPNDWRITRAIVEATVAAVRNSIVGNRGSRGQRKIAVVPRENVQDTGNGFLVPDVTNLPAEPVSVADEAA